MKQLNRIKLFLLIGLLTTLLTMANFFGTTVYAQKTIENEDSIINNINSNIYTEYNCNNGDELQEDLKDSITSYILEDISGSGCGSTCGASREGGYSASYASGCKNWLVMPKYSPIFKYWIDEATLSSLTNEQKEEFIVNVDKAAAEWNSVRIADYSGAIVNIEKQSSNGTGIVPVRYNPTLEGYDGLFNPIPGFHQIEIKEYNDYSTIMHEFGHMLGLQDLDNIDSRTHISLMGYKTNGRLHYQDIQGLAVANNKHTTHDFRRYWKDDSWYRYVCFYCDVTDSRLALLSGKEHLEEAATCIHEFESLASAGYRHWLKCTKCYQVIESEFNITGENDNGSCGLKILGFLNDNVDYIIIPDTIGGIKVTSIGASAFKGCSSLKSIILSSNVKHIEESAFEGCSSLQLVALPNNIISIGASAFKGCSSLESIVFPSSLEYIEENAFMNCSSLSSVTIERKISDITQLGANAFDDCNSNLQIIVPPNRIAEYKNKTYWSSYKNKITSESIVFDEIDLHCLINGSQRTSLNAGYNKMYKLNVECSKSYKFTSTSDVKMFIYNENLEQIYTGNNTLYAYLSQGIYYFDIRYESNTDSGVVTFNYELRWPNDGEKVDYNKENNLLPHLHETSDGNFLNKMYYVNSNKAGIFKFTIEAVTTDGTIISLPLNSLTIYKSKTRETPADKLPVTDLTGKAINKAGENSLIVYLLKDECIYIDVNFNNSEFSKLSLFVSTIQSQNINLFNLSENNNELINVMNENKKGDYFKLIDLKQTGKFTITFNYSGNQSNNILALLVKQNYDPNTLQYSLDLKFIGLINKDNQIFTYTVGMEAGTYYIGYFNKEDVNNFTITLNRLITQSNPNVLVTDPDRVTEAGSQINIIEKDIDVFERSYRQSHITVGFTRLTYPNYNYGISPSRLDYDWYTSNENIATVTKYGTVLGRSVGTVKIMAVLKEDPSKVFIKEFNIIEDTGTGIVELQSTHTVKYATDVDNNKFHFEMENILCPYPWLQDYSYNIRSNCHNDSFRASMDEWGDVTINGKGCFTLTGTYLVNNRFKIKVHFIIE